MPAVSSLFNRSLRAGRAGLLPIMPSCLQANRRASKVRGGRQQSHQAGLQLLARAGGRLAHQFFHAPEWLAALAGLVGGGLSHQLVDVGLAWAPGRNTPRRPAQVGEAHEEKDPRNWVFIVEWTRRIGEVHAIGSFGQFENRQIANRKSARARARAVRGRACGWLLRHRSVP